MIPIKKLKQIREDLDLAQIIIFGVDENLKQYVASHGKTNLDAKQCADFANEIKKELNWPEKPLERICDNCHYLKWPDARGLQYGESHKCLYEPKAILKNPQSIACHHFEPNC